MRFSKRTDWNTEESELARAHRLRLAAGLPVADLTVSNPTRCGFRYDPALVDSLADAKALDYDPQPKGTAQAREAVAKYYADAGVEILSSQIVLTTSTSEAYSFLFRLLCDPGCALVAPQPSYPLFEYLAGLDDVGREPGCAERRGSGNYTAVVQDEKVAWLKMCRKSRKRTIAKHAGVASHYRHAAAPRSAGGCCAMNSSGRS